MTWVLRIRRGMHALTVVCCLEMRMKDVMSVIYVTLLDGNIKKVIQVSAPTKVNE